MLCPVWELWPRFWASSSPWARWAVPKKKSASMSRPPWWALSLAFSFVTAFSLRWPAPWANRTTPRVIISDFCAWRPWHSSKASAPSWPSNWRGAPSQLPCGPPSRKWKPLAGALRLPQPPPQRRKYALRTGSPASTDQSPADHNHQEEGLRSRGPSRRRLEGGLRRFRHRYDGPVHRALADERGQRSPAGRQRLFQQPHRPGQTDPRSEE